MENGVVLNEDTKSISINVNEELFSEMLMGFLGKKQTIRYVNLKDNFDVTIDDLCQFHYYFEQKLKREQYTTINNLNVDFDFDDMTTYSLNGIDNLSKYTDHENKIPISVTMTWDIVLSFPGNSVIEHQKVSLSLGSVSLSDHSSEFRNSIPNDIDSFVRLEVETTNQAWGIEVSNLFRKHIESLIKKVPLEIKVTKFINKYVLTSYALIASFFIFFMFSTFQGNNYEFTKSALKIEYLEKAVKVNDVNEISSLDNYILMKILEARQINNKVLTNYIKSDDLKNIMNDYIDKFESQQFTGLIAILGKAFLVVIFAFMLKLYVIQTNKFYMNESYLLLTKEIKKKYNLKQESQNRLQHYSVIVLVLAALSSVIASFIYDFLK